MNSKTSDIAYDVVLAKKTLKEMAKDLNQPDVFQALNDAKKKLEK